MKNKFYQLAKSKKQIISRICNLFLSINPKFKTLSNTSKFRSKMMSANFIIKARSILWPFTRSIKVNFEKIFFIFEGIQMHMICKIKQFFSRNEQIKYRVKKTENKKAQFILSYGELKRLPDIKRIMGDVFLGPEFDYLPEDLVIYGNLHVSGSNIKKLPQSMVITGNLYLNEEQLKSLSENTSVEGVIYPDMNTKKIADDLIIYGTLDIRNTQINQLPKNLEISKNFYLNEEQLKFIQNGICVNGMIVPDESTMFLQEYLQVNGNLILAKTKIKRLPAGLKVTGRLNVRHSQLREIPEDVVVTNGIILQHIEKNAA